MSIINYKLKVTDSANQISAEFIKALHSQISSVLRVAAPRIESRVKQLVKLALQASNTYESLTTGALQVDFGFEKNEGFGFANGIIKLVVDRIEVRVSNIKRTAKTIKASIFIGLIPTDYGDLFRSKFAKYESVTSTSIEQVDWLKWLLTAGTQYVVMDHHIVFNVPQNILDKYSRSGGALMHKGGHYSVPSKFAGTKDDNWITRVLDKLEDDILKIMEEEVIRAIP